jgi:hypothetical protein
LFFYIFFRRVPTVPRIKTVTARSLAAQIEKSYKKTKTLLEESMQGLPKGCKSYLDHVLSLAKLDQSHRDELAARGLVPINLGTASKTVYQFTATVDTQSGPLDAERQKFEDEMEELYPDSSQAPPAPAVKKLKKKNRSTN